MGQTPLLFCGQYKSTLMKSVITLLFRNILEILECLLTPGSFRKKQPIFAPVIRNRRIKRR